MVDYGKPLTELIAWYMHRTVPFFESKGFPNIEDTYITQNGGKLPNEGEVYKNIYLAHKYLLDLL